MNEYDCDTVQDQLPAYVRNELLPPEAAAVASHVGVCGNCAAEASVVGLVYAAQTPVPTGLEARVLLAVRRPASRRLWPSLRLAAAAAVASMIVGGSLLMQRVVLLDSSDAAPAVVTRDANDASTFSWAAAENPLLHGSSALQQLSVEELELLLAELES
jgi:anti-sigma factor RsiW